MQGLGIGVNMPLPDGNDDDDIKLMALERAATTQMASQR